MPDIVLAIFDEVTGQLLLDAEQREFLAEAGVDLAQYFRDGTRFGCANPTEPQQFTKPASDTAVLSGFVLRVRDYWHNSLVEGPGRRSVVRLQGCPIRCKGCWVPETHDEQAGQLVGINTVAETLLDKSYSRDGVTILGGEPFAQPQGLAWLVARLRDIEPDLHITVYSGYTLQRLIQMNNPYINDVLGEIDVLIDGPYVEALKDGAGPWTGSGNQQVRYLR